MDAELKQRWITALTDGSFKKGRSQLRRGNTYCCLGVLAKVTGREFSDQGLWDKCTWNKSYLPDAIANEVGLHDCDMKNLAQLNDAHDGLDGTFPQTIIDYINENL